VNAAKKQDGKRDCLPSYTFYPVVIKEPLRLTHQINGKGKAEGYRFIGFC
jgi:hypothetical protein